MIFEIGDLTINNKPVEAASMGPEVIVRAADHDPGPRRYVSRSGRPMFGVRGAGRWLNTARPTSKAERRRIWSRWAHEARERTARRTPAFAAEFSFSCKVSACVALATLQNRVHGLLSKPFTLTDPGDATHPFVAEREPEG